MYANVMMKLVDYDIKKSHRELKEISAFVSEYVTYEDSILSCGIKDVAE